MANTSQTAVSDGTLTYLPLTIEYLSRDDVHVYLGADEVPEGRWDWVGRTDHAITFNPAVPAGFTVRVQRITTTDALYHSFTDGAQFTAGTLDEALTQTLYVAQEFKDVAAVASDIVPRSVGPRSIAGYSNQFSRADHVHAITDISGVAVTYVSYRLSGDGVSKVFYLPTVPLNDNALQLFVGGVYQYKLTYTRAGARLTFAEAPPQGTDNIEAVMVGVESDIVDGAVGTVDVYQRSGDGVTTAFSLGAVPVDGSEVNVYVEGIRQSSTTYVRLDAQIMFSEAPPAGTNNIELVVTGPIAN